MAATTTLAAGSPFSGSCSGCAPVSPTTGAGLSTQARGAAGVTPTDTRNGKKPASFRSRTHFADMPRYSPASSKSSFLPTPAPSLPRTEPALAGARGPARLQWVPRARVDAPSPGRLRPPSQRISVPFPSLIRGYYGRVTPPQWWYGTRYYVRPDAASWVGLLCNET